MNRKGQNLNVFFRKLLKDFREQSNLTQKEVANLIGTGQASICNFENEKKGITLDLASKFLNLFEKRLFVVDSKERADSKRPLRVFYIENIKNKFSFEKFDEFRRWLFKDFLGELVNIQVDSAKVFDIIKFYERDSNGDIFHVEEPTLTEEGEDLVVIFLTKNINNQTCVKN
ncbi:MULTISPECIES: helix-turn-helix transcriptional regulator [Psychrilyobacter]|uniref:Helix-turn-helix domain-containing protein n=1 Tax=Psychrilyobacter piezotolerans TaxID=2293438 RepID=A0ABX9KDK7_9FUSO|nr:MULTISPECIES: helix-turn-helix transcriptional regulator [Psychrilyobacter]MCS5423194.1 helix-turn-helix domain-containing protein [Psychrilyobacter sp. S5]NDI78205.1 helix-turn-helix transcriptional regulator [Psychrilyobacter piezotolerans]RDE58968.1 XRE family transcriptional regulator [Psychrilyobacter sp. S5]REI39527.1 helix-turn-helix domain-containing protein [Psychrilyobacter piezotolerans]